MEQSQQQRYLVIGLAVLAVVLAGFVVFLVLGSRGETNTALPTASNTAGQAAASQTGTATTAAAPSNFDPAKATKVPAGTSPEKFVDEYYAAVVKKDYATAFKHLPADKQAASSVDEFKAQLEGYGITGYKVTSATQQGDQFVVNADQETSTYGTFGSTWVFVKNGDIWVVQSKQTK